MAELNLVPMAMVQVVAAQALLADPLLDLQQMEEQVVPVYLHHIQELQHFTLAVAADLGHLAPFLVDQAVVDQQLMQ